MCARMCGFVDTDCDVLQLFVTIYIMCNVVMSLCFSCFYLLPNEFPHGDNKVVFVLYCILSLIRDRSHDNSLQYEHCVHPTSDTHSIVSRQPGLETRVEW